MSLHATRAAALLAWVNSFKIDHPLSNLSELQDCRVFAKIIDKICGTEDGQSALQQPLPERVTFVCSFLHKQGKHKSAVENLVCGEKLLAGEELELAKVAMLLLYHTSMTSKNPRDWNEFEYQIQAELATILKFVLDNEENLSQNLEIFLQKKALLSSSSVSSTSSEEHSPVFSWRQQKREVRFVELQRIASSSSVNNLLPGSPAASPMGEILQTPQFQLRRLKKQLAAERENRDELELELAEHRKLIAEKDTKIAMLQQRIDRLALLNERQAADQLEPKELEELREKNESLIVRLHEALKQCQDLKTEKGQMDRKINQLSEENGDLSFKLREFASHLMQLQGALNEVSEEYNKALKEWGEKQVHLESELHAAVSEKKCSEEKVEILQGKVSLLEDQLAKLRESAPQEKGEVMGDILKLESLKQELTSLAAKGNELQDTIHQLQEEKSLCETQLQTEKSRFEEEKLQLTALVANLQSSVSEISLAKEKLEQASQAQEAHLTSQVNTLTAEIAKLNDFILQRDQELQQERSQKDQLAEDLQKQEQVSRATVQALNLQLEQLSSTLKQSQEKLAQMEAASQGDARQLASLREEHGKAIQEQESALRQLHDFKQRKEAELVALRGQLQTLEKAREARQASAVAMERERAELSRRVQGLEARILELTTQCQQSDVQAGAVPALKAQLRDLELKLKEAQQKQAEKEKLAKENTRLQERLLVLEESVRNTEGILEDEKRRAGESLEGNVRRITELESQVQELAEHRSQALQEMGKEKTKRQALEAQVQQLGEESRAKAEVLQRQLAELTTGEQGKLEEKLKVLRADHERACQQLQAEREKAAGLEAQAKRLTAEQQEKVARLQAELSRALAQAQGREGAEGKLRAELSSLQEKLAASRQEATQHIAQLEKDTREAALTIKAVTEELSDERLRVTELEATVTQLSEQKSQELTAAESKLSSAISAKKEREREAEKLSSEVKMLTARLEKAQQQLRHELAQRDVETKRLARETEQAKAELAAEKAGKVELEVQLQNATNEHRVEIASLQGEVLRSRTLAEEKERELEELRLKNVSRNEELRELQKTVSKLKGELASVEALKERAAKMENELQGFLEVARTQEAEMDNMKSLVRAKEVSLKSLEEEKLKREEESKLSREVCQEQLRKNEALRSEVEKLERRCKEQRDAIAGLEKAAANSEKHQAQLEALKKEIAQHKEKASELEKLLRASQSAQAGQDKAVEKLKRELVEKGKELVQSREAEAGAEKELASLRASAQEKGKVEDGWKEQVSLCLQDLERKNSLIGSLEQEVSILHRQVLEKEGESKELKRLIVAESEKSKKLEERLRLLQSEMATAASRAAERCSAMKAEAQNYQEQAEKLRTSLEALKRELGSQGEREEDLHQELKSWQEKYFQKEQLLSSLQVELTSAQALIEELMPVKLLYQQQQAEQASLESKHHQELEQRQKAASALQAELARARLDLAELLSLKEKVPEQERDVQRLQAENASYAEQLAALQRTNAQLAEERQELDTKSSRGLQKLEAELAQAKEKHAQELETVKLEWEKLTAGSKHEASEALKKLESVTNKYENAKVKVLEERQKFQEEREKLLAQVEQLEVFQKDQAKQVEELNKKLSQQPRAKELQAEVSCQQAKIAELQEQLTEREQAAEHYKAQMEKAKTHYDAKKQQNQELSEMLKGTEQLQKENAELKAESERLAKELQQSILQAKESELSCKNLTGQVRSLEAQVEHADRQLRELGRFQVPTDALKSRDTYRQSQSEADVSTDSLDLSNDETLPLNSTRKTTRSHSDTSAIVSSVDSRASQRLPRKVESLESLYFTPIPTRTRSKLESSLGSLSDQSLDSERKTRSARRRTTQIINITMTKKQAESEEPDSVNASFYSVDSARSQPSAPAQDAAKSRLRSGVSTRSLASCPSQESLTRLGAASPDETPENAVLRSLPGYRPATRSSMRHSQLGPAGGSSSSLGRSSFYLGTCQDEPDALDDWNRIAELQQRNRVCPPHMKTCYPLESRPSQPLSAITDEEMKTGDPQETLRRASIQPSQTAEGARTRRGTLSTGWAAGNIAARQLRKRSSAESHHGPETPESKKPTSCFPRPQTPKGRNEEGSRKAAPKAASKQSDRRQSLAFSILNTPKKLGNSLLRRGANRKVTPKNSPRGSTRRSPRIATAKSPKGKVSRKTQKDTKF